MAKETPAVNQTENIYQVVVRPLLTERSTLAKDKFNQYAFEVGLKSDKGQIKRAVEQLFKVNVEKVRTMIIPGKFRRYGRGGGMKSDWKKAVVTIAKGQKIEVAEQV
jgi:large subunit ribosomal protein L23